MYEYKFVRIGIKGRLLRKPEQDYRSIIEEYAKNGWRFVQVFAPPIGGYGVALYFELIFEKQLDKQT